jgi:hypothetical protein
MDHGFLLLPEKVVFRAGQGSGNCRAVETLETNRMFSTVPTALGKLGKLRPSFPQFPQPLRLIH